MSLSNYAPGNKFVTDFKDKAEFLNFYSATQRSLVINSSKLPSYIHYLNYLTDIVYPL